MSHKTTYTCDQCKSPIGDLYGPLFVQVSAERHPIVERAELCSFDCMDAWIKHIGNFGKVADTA